MKFIGGNEWHGKPDWLHWLKVGYVDSWEGVALAHDLDPVTYTEPINTNQRTVLITILPPDIRAKYKAARQHFGDRELMPLREFAAWAQSESWPIPAEMAKITGIPKIEAPTSQPDTAQEGNAAISGSINRSEVMAAFTVKPDLDANTKFWDGRLSRPSNGLKDAREHPGKPGTSALWNPLTLAHWLLAAKHMTLKQLDATMNRHFPGLRDSWIEQTEDKR